MKIKTTRKAIIATSPRLVSVGYCEVQTLLRYHSPVAYNSGVYGWNFDVYQIHGLTICTGYRGMPGRRANNAGEYERKAREAVETLGWEEAEAEVERLLTEFCNQA